MKKNKTKEKNEPSFNMALATLNINESRLNFYWGFFEGVKAAEKILEQKNSPKSELNTEEPTKETNQEVRKV